MFLADIKEGINMSALQEVLTVLLGAESEGKRIVEDAKNDSVGIIKTTQEIFLPDRESRMASTREQAKGLMENALLSAQTEAKQILDLGREERERVLKRFDENVDTVIAAVLAETADKILSGGE
jgi:F-type H+-transporting ATPase subunit b